MTQAGTIVRQRIQAQGFCGLDHETYARINYPLRLSPAICMVWTALGTALSSPTILWALAPFAALGAILPGHPFDVLYNHALRRVLGTPALPHYGFRRRFACALATVMISRRRMGLPGGQGHGRLHRRLVACNCCLREREHGFLYTLVHRADILRPGGAGGRGRQPRPINGILVAITVMNSTLASRGRLAM